MTNYKHLIVYLLSILNSSYALSIPLIEGSKSNVYSRKDSAIFTSLIFKKSIIFALNDFSNNGRNDSLFLVSNDLGKSWNFIKDSSIRNFRSWNMKVDRKTKKIFNAGWHYQTVPGSDVKLTKGALYLSDNSGKSWQLIGTDHYHDSTYLDSVAKGNLIYVCGMGVSKEGKHFSFVLEKNWQSKKFRQIDRVQATTVANSANCTGIVNSSRRGLVTSGWQHNPIDDKYYGIVRKSSNRNRSWRTTLSIPGFTPYGISKLQKKLLIYGGQDGPSGRSCVIKESLDQGETWQTVFDEKSDLHANCSLTDMSISNFRNPIAAGTIIVKYDRIQNQWIKLKEVKDKDAYWQSAQVLRKSVIISKSINQEKSRKIEIQRIEL